MKIDIYFILFLTSYFKKIDCSLFEQPYLKDAWGFKINWTDLEDGWNDAKRKLMVRQKRSFTLRQNDIPRYTEKGYKKMKINENLFSMIKRVKESAELRPEFCEVPNYENNCYRVKKEHDMSTINGTRELIGIFKSSARLVGCELESRTSPV